MAVTDEVMAERRRLFLEEMARIREREQQAQGIARAAAPPSIPAVPAGGPPARQSTHVAPPRAALLLLALCVTLTFPIFGYIRREAQLMLQTRGRNAGWSEDGRLVGPPDGDSRRAEDLHRARLFFGLPDIIALQQGEYGPTLLLRAGLSRAGIIAHARRVQDTMSARGLPPPRPLPWRIGVCSADTPCAIAVVHTFGPHGDGAWDVAEGPQILR